MLYVAVPVDHPRIAIVRLALPLTEVQQQVAAVRQHARSSRSAWRWSARWRWRGWRRRCSAGGSGRWPTRPGAYASGDLSRRLRDYEPDEARHRRPRARRHGARTGAAARRSWPRTARAWTPSCPAWWKASSSSTTRAASSSSTGPRARCWRSTTAGVGGHYLEAVRHPGVAALLTEALAGRRAATHLELSPARTPGRHLVARAAPMSAPSATGAVLVLHDITDLRRADQVRRDFVANVSHELRTPLTAIRGYVEALADEPAEPRGSRPVPRGHRAPRRADGAAREGPAPAGRASTRDRSRRAGAVPGAGAARRHGLRPRDGDRRAAPARSRSRSTRRSPRSAPTPAKLQDALRNLVENAVNYSPEGRRIRARRAAEAGPGRDHRVRRRPRHPGSRTSSGSSSGSTGWTRRGRGNRAAPASGCRSSSTWWACSAAASGPRTGRRAARCSPSACRATDRAGRAESAVPSGLPSDLAIGYTP